MSEGSLRPFTVNVAMFLSVAVLKTSTFEDLRRQTKICLCITVIPRMQPAPGIRVTSDKEIFCFLCAGASTFKSLFLGGMSAGATPSWLDDRVPITLLDPVNNFDTASDVWNLISMADFGGNTTDSFSIKFLAF